MQKTNGIFNFIFSFKPPQTGRYPWVDYAKGIAIIFVAYRHVIYGLLYRGVEITPTMMDANELLYGFRMPLFFFLSGLFFAASVKKKGPENFLISKVNVLLYPYLLWAVLQLSLQLLFSDFTNAKRGLDNYFDILIHPRSMLQLWYLFALFNVSALYLFTDQVLKLKPWMQLLLGILLITLKPLAGEISTLTDVMIHYVYFALGHKSASYFFSEKVQHQLASIPKLLILLPVVIAVQYYCMKNQDMNIYLFSVLALAGGVAVIMVSMLLAKYNRLTFLQTIGHYSLYIYLLHVGIIFMLRTLIIQLNITDNVALIALFLVAAGIFLSIVLYRCLLLLGARWLFKGPFREVEKKDEKRLPLKSLVL